MQPRSRSERRTCAHERVNQLGGLEPGTEVRLIVKASGKMVDLGKVASATASEIKLDQKLKDDVRAGDIVVAVEASMNVRQKGRQGTRNLKIKPTKPLSVNTSTILLVDQEGRAIDLGPPVRKTHGKLTTLVLRDKLKSDFPFGASVLVGHGRKPLSSEDGFLRDGKDGLAFHFAKTDLDSLEDGDPVFLVKYDYETHARVKCGDLTCSPTLGSLLVTADPGKASGTIENTTQKPTEPCKRDSAWFADAHGYAIHLNGLTELGQSRSTRPKPFDVLNDLSLETWINPETMPGSYIISHHSEDSQYSLGLAENPSALRFDKQKSYVSIPEMQALTCGTIEAWIRG